MVTSLISIELTKLLEQAYIIADQNKLYGIKKKIPRSHEASFNPQENNFGYYVSYSLNEPIYNEWIVLVTDTLEIFNLQSSKFRVNINRFEPSEESNLPAQKFLRAIAELEKIKENKLYRDSYTKSNSLDAVRFTYGKLIQGIRERQLHDDYRELIALLWNSREIKSSDQKITQQHKPTTQSMIETKLNINKTRLEAMSKSIAAYEKDSGIHVKLRRPTQKDIYISITQNE